MSEEQLKNQPQEYLVTDLSDLAEIAIKGMGPSSLADELRMWEHMRLPIRKTSRPWMILAYSREEIKMLREEVYTLVRSVEEIRNRKDGANIREDFYQAYVKQNDELRQFRGFLAEHFAAQLDEGVELNLPLLHVAKKLLLEYKKRV